MKKQKKVGRVVENLKEDVELELPSETSVSLKDLGFNDIDTEASFLNDALSDWLSDTYGFCHYGFDYDVIDGKVYISNIRWDTSESLEEDVALNESTGNFGSNDIINLCSPYLDVDDYKDEIMSIADISDDELEERIENIINDDYDDMYKQVKQSLEDVDEYVTVEAGYYKGFYINFRFDDGKELAENWFYYDKDYAVAQFKKTVETIRTALKASVEEGSLVGYEVAYRMSNGETGYNLDKNKDSTLKSIDDAMNVVLEEGMKALEEEYIDEI